MAAVEEYLIRRGDGLVILFTPPFDKSKLDPGYIKGYVPGVRENGGQYTHAALWTLIAFAMLGDGERAGELFGVAESDQSLFDARRSAQIQSRALRRGWAMSMRCRRTRAAAVGRGTRVRRAGCIARDWNPSSGLSCRAIVCASIRAFRVAGANLRSLIGAAARRIGSKLRIRTRCRAASPPSNSTARSN